MIFTPVTAQEKDDNYKFFLDKNISKSLKDDLVETTVTVDWPAGGTRDTLRTSIMMFFNEQLSFPVETYWMGPYGMVTKCAQIRFQELGEEAQNNKNAGMSISAPYYNNTEIKCIYEGKKIVTYTSTTSVYTGGAHPMTQFVPVTFLKEYGNRIGYDVFKNTNSKVFKDAIIYGLKKYFNVKSDNELKSYLLDVKNLKKIPLPKANPYITDEGICLVYGQYEIAAYAYGMPKVVITKEVAKTLLKDASLIE